MITIDSIQYTTEHSEQDITSQTVSENSSLLHTTKKGIYKTITNISYYTKVTRERRGGGLVSILQTEEAGCRHHRCMVWSSKTSEVTEQANVHTYNSGNLDNWGDGT